ncbi:MAG: HAD-IA family hydrolase [Planctomycetota bacterium]
MIKGVIFDMDGVLVDSEKFICEAAIRMFAEHGVEMQPEDFVPFIGAGEDRYISGPAEKAGFPINVARDKARLYEIYAEIVRGRLRPLDGAHEFIGRCRGRGLKVALATSADKSKMLVNLREIGVSPETFDATVNGLEVEKKKPDPEIFLAAAKKLGVPAADCLVVEDAVNGVAAAKAAGARCLALLTSFSKEELAGADWYANTLADAPDDAINW